MRWDLKDDLTITKNCVLETELIPSTDVWDAYRECSVAPVIFAAARNIYRSIVLREIRTTRPYIGLTSEVEQVGLPVTSDKWWIANKWGISAGNIRDIKKGAVPLARHPHPFRKAPPPLPPRHIRHLDRLKSDATKLFLSNDGIRWWSFVDAWAFFSSRRLSMPL